MKVCFKSYTEEGREDKGALLKQDPEKLRGCPGLDLGCADVSRSPGPARTSPGPQAQRGKDGGHKAAHSFTVTAVR